MLISDKAADVPSPFAALLDPISFPNALPAPKFIAPHIVFLFSCTGEATEPEGKSLLVVMTVSLEV